MGRRCQQGELKGVPVGVVMTRLTPSLLSTPRTHTYTAVWYTVAE